MKEQSHKREMGAALRGDFERLRARRRDETPPIETPAQIAATPDVHASPEVEAEMAPAAESTTGGSWLDRLRGRT